MPSAILGKALSVRLLTPLCGTKLPGSQADLRDVPHCRPGWRSGGWPESPVRCVEHCLQQAASHTKVRRHRSGRAESGKPGPVSLRIGETCARIAPFRGNLCQYRSYQCDLGLGFRVFDLKLDALFREQPGKTRECKTALGRIYSGSSPGRAGNAKQH